nr:rod-determining factor RdfA [Salinadaptatus halalkaliphilus]
MIDQYDLDDIGAEIEAAWTSDDEHRRSLRDLADDFNQELLRQKLRDAGIQTLDGEVENFYRLLTDDETSTADRTRIRRRLERDDIDVGTLESEFVSYQAIRTYLQNHRGASYDPAETDPIDQLQTAVDRLQRKLVTVTDDRLERVDDNTALTIENPSVIADVRIACANCGRQFSVDELTAETQCDCVGSDS